MGSEVSLVGGGWGGGTKSWRLYKESTEGSKISLDLISTMPAHHSTLRDSGNHFNERLRSTLAGFVANYRSNAMYTDWERFDFKTF